LRSRRPLTAILVGPRPTSATLDAMTRVCRVLPVAPVDGREFEEVLNEWLAILMPLVLPQPSSQLADPLNELLAALADRGALEQEFYQVALEGADAVRQRLRGYVGDPLPEDRRELDS
jgi:hypothetical protein